MTELNPPPRMPRRIYAILVSLLLAAGLISTGDVDISQYFVRWDLPSDLRKAVTLSEVFSHGMGIALILIVLFTAVPQLRRKMWRLAACPISAGIASNLVKMLIARYRPQYFYQQSEGKQLQEISNTFLEWLPIAYREDWHDHLVQSFPSAHTTAAFAFAVGLSWAVPKGRVAFFAVAILAGIQRIESQSHWPSDVVAGAALGLLSGSIVCYSSFGNWIFRRLEKPPGNSEAA